MDQRRNSPPIEQSIIKQRINNDTVKNSVSPSKNKETIPQSCFLRTVKAKEKTKIHNLLPLYTHYNDARLNFIALSLLFLPVDKNRKQIQRAGTVPDLKHLPPVYSARLNYTAGARDSKI